MIYEWREGSRCSADPQTVGELVERIAERDGVCRPGVFAVEVSDPDHPAFRDVFSPADEASAAWAWWTHKARNVIGDLTVKVEGSTVRPAAFLSVEVIRADGEVDRGYRPRMSVQMIDSQHEQAVAEALAALNGWRRRYSHLKDDPLLREFFA